MKAMSKAFILSASVMLVQVGIMMAVYFFTDIRNLGYVLTGALCFSTIILWIRMESRLMNTSGEWRCHPMTPVEGHPASLFIIGVSGMLYLSTLYFLPTKSALIFAAVATALSTFCLVDEGINFVREEQERIEPTPRGVTLFVLAVPQIVVAVSAAATLWYGI